MKIRVDEQNRVIGWCSIGDIQDGIEVTTVPQGNCTDYLYLNGEYVYSPQQKHEQEQDYVQTLQSRVAQLEEQNNTLLECLLEMSEIVYA